MKPSENPSYSYESIEFNLSDGQSDYDLDSQQVTFLAVFSGANPNPGLPTQVRIRTNQTITVKINSTSAHAITIASTDTPFDIKGIVIKNLYLSNSSGSTAAVKLLFQDSEYPSC